MQDGPRFLTETDLSTVTTTQQTAYGARGITGDGRKFVYVKFAGTSTVNPGLLMVAPAAPANSTGLAIASTNSTAQLAAGSKSLVVTNGSTSVTTDQFAGGFLEVTVAAGGQYSLRIDGNTSAGNAGAINFTLVDPIPAGATALIPGTDTVNLRVSPYNGVAASTTAGLPVGVTTNVVPNTSTVTNWGWLQTEGSVEINATSTIAAGAAISQDVSGTAGYVITCTTTSYQLGVARTAAASGLVSAVVNLA